MNGNDYANLGFWMLQDKMRTGLALLDETLPAEELDDFPSGRQAFRP